MNRDLVVLLCKLAVAVMAVVILVGLGHRMGYNSRQPAFDDLNKRAVAAETDVRVLQGKVDAYSDVATAVEGVRELIAEQSKGRRADAQRMLNAVSKGVTRTGNECVDAKAVADQYFRDLKSGAVK